MKILHYEGKPLIEGKEQNFRKWKIYHWRNALNSRLDPAGKRIDELEEEADESVQNKGGKGKVMR